MIPSIEQIVADLVAGDCSQAEAIEWLNQHVAMASEEFNVRQHFAGLAMQGAIAARANPSALGIDAPAIAKEAVECADALIEELVRTEEEKAAA